MMYECRWPVRERRWCPPEFQEILREAGGLNPYGESIFKLAWSGTETIVGGGYWDGNGLVGYKEIPARNGAPCWMVMMWEQGGEGSPWLYYFRHRDAMTGLCDVGEYPYAGRYGIARPLVWTGVVGSKQVTEHLELTGFLLEVLVANIKAWKHLSLERRRLAEAEEAERQDFALRKEMSDAIVSCRPAFGAASITVAKKVEMFERNWQKVMQMGRELQRSERGFKQEMQR